MTVSILVSYSHSGILSTIVISIITTDTVLLTELCALPEDQERGTDLRQRLTDSDQSLSSSWSSLAVLRAVLRLIVSTTDHATTEEA